MKKHTPGESKTWKGDLGKKGYPGGLKPESAVQAKEGLKRTTASSMIVCALVKASWIIPGRDQSETSCSEGRKHGESEDIWGVTELELDEITGFTLPLG